ncbi:MAG: TIGR00266 family protein [bacterium]
MRYQLLYQPVSTMAQFDLEQGEQLLVEPGAMVGMTPGLDMITGLAKQSGGGGIFGAITAAAGRLLAGESFFQNTFTATRGPEQLLLAHTLPGDMAMIDVQGAGLKLQSTAFVASTPGVQTTGEFGGARTFFGGEGLFLLSATANAPNQQILIGAFGGIQELQCNGSLVIDTGHLVAWDASLTFNVTKASSGWISSYLTGEGLVCSFQGQGRIWMQTRNPPEFGSKVGRLLPPRTN